MVSGQYFRTQFSRMYMRPIYGTLCMNGVPVLSKFALGCHSTFFVINTTFDHFAGDLVSMRL